jgi:hypothetical protein
MHGEARVTHVTPECLGPQSLKAEVASFSFAMPVMALDAHAVLRAHPVILPMNLTACHGLKGPSRRCDGAHTGEDMVPKIGHYVTVLYQLALERPGLEMKTSARRWSELSACCSMATPRMFFICWYTLLTPSVEGTGRVSKVRWPWLRSGKP